jgi:homoserine kinase
VSAEGHKRATAFAPASVGNVGVGFDILGFSLDALGDRVSATAVPARGVSIVSISGVAGDLPMDAASNTAGRAVEALLAAASAPFGVTLEIEKGIPLASGLGGSASSAVAAVVAANALLAQPLDKLGLLKCAMQGEAVASGALHVDNVAPSLFGGLVLTVGIDEPRVKQIPVPAGIRAVVVHPHMQVTTKQARGILSRTVALSDFVWQSANLAGYIAGCYSNDLDLIRASFEDVVIEPQRKALIPGFDAAQVAARAQGALCCTISGAGPTMFAWALEADANNVRDAMVAAFASAGFGAGAWVADIAERGAHLVAD